MYRGGFILRAGAPAALLASLALLAGCGSAPGATPATAAAGTPTVTWGYRQCPPTNQPAPGSPGAFDGDDGFDTRFRGLLTIDKPGCSSTITNLDTADNWMLRGAAGQNIVVWVEAFGSADPQVTLFDPNGEDMDVDDNSGGGENPMFQDELPENGIYTLRVTLFVEGAYTITVKTGKPES